MNCAICLSSDGFPCEQRQPSVDGIYYDCEVCGSYLLTNSASRGAIHPDGEHLTVIMRAVLSHRVRLANYRMEDGGDFPTVNSRTIDHLIQENPSLPTPAQQATSIIRYIGDAVNKTGEGIGRLPPSFHATIGSPNRRFAEKLVRELLGRGLSKGVPAGDMQHPDAVIGVDLSLSGWEAFEAEKRGQVSGSTGFIALQFGDDELDHFLESVIKPAVRELGYELEDMHDATEAGIIDNVMRAKIRDAAFVLVELSHGNEGAYWEAGYAEGLGKPVLYLCKQEVFDATGTHFDTNHCTTVKWNPHAAEAFKLELIATLRRSLGLF